MDRIAYVHPTYIIKGVDVITPQALDALLAQGWTVQSREKEAFGGKQVTVVHLHQEEGRGVSVAPQRGHALAQMREEFQRSLMPAAPPAGNRGYLGGSELSNMPGMHVTNSLKQQHVYAQGVDAAYAGKSAVDCPFTEPHARVEWLKGHSSGSKASKAGGAAGGSTDDAFFLGKQAAMGDKDTEVVAPYPFGTPHYNRWLDGFRASGGRIE